MDVHFSLTLIFFGGRFPLKLLPTIDNIPDVGIRRRKAMAGLGRPHLDIGESARISILNSPFSDSIKLDFKEMLSK